MTPVPSPVPPQPGTLLVPGQRAADPAAVPGTGAASGAVGAGKPPSAASGASGAAETPPASKGAAGPALWLVDALKDADAALLLAPDILDADERKRAAAFHRDRDRRMYTAAHVALRMLLGDRLRTAPETVEFIREECPTCGGPHGRPAVPGGRLHFSLSHSGGLALIGLADTVIGVDVEQTPTLDVADQTARMLHPDETAELEALPEDARAVGFGRAWTRKEAYLKAIGTGLSRSPALDYMGTGPAPAQHQPDWTLADVAVPEGYLAAVATRR